MRILIADRLDRCCAEYLRAEGFDVAEEPAITEEALRTAIPPFAGLVVRSRIRIRAEHFEAAGNLKVVARAGAGVDNIDVAAATRRGVAVLNAPGANTESVAEHVFALLLAACRRIPDACRAFREGRWDRNLYLGTELEGKTLGIVGLGRIGRRVARIGQALGMRIVANSPGAMRDPERRRRIVAEGIELLDLMDLLSRSDFVTLHCPLNQQTRGMLGEEQLRRMKKTAILVNTSRGGIIDDAALERALREGWIAGACLDVFAEEPPPPDSPWRSLPNVVATPHLAASTAEAQERAAQVAAREVARVLREGRSEFVVNPEVLAP